MLYFVNQANKEITSGKLEKFLPHSVIHMVVKSLRAVFPLFSVSAESLYTLHSINKAVNKTVHVEVGAILEPSVFHSGNFGFCSVVYMCVGLYSYRQGGDICALQSFI